MAQQILLVVLLAATESWPCQPSNSVLAFALVLDSGRRYSLPDSELRHPARPKAVLLGPGFNSTGTLLTCYHQRMIAATTVDSVRQLQVSTLSLLWLPAALPPTLWRLRQCLRSASSLSDKGLAFSNMVLAFQMSFGVNLLSGPHLTESPIQGKCLLAFVITPYQGSE